MTAAKITMSGDIERITWDVSNCPALDYNLYAGPLGSVSSYGYDSWQCSLGASGSADTTPGAGSVFFVIIPVNGTMEGSHGYTSAGAERNASGVGHCGVTSKDTSGTCP